MSMMKPMMFTMVFIIAIFSWMAESVEDFKVNFVSLPWNPMWSFDARVFWIFPAWIATYISMSAPLGRIIDRHIKLLRYAKHPLVISQASIPEPLMHMLDEEKNINSTNNSRRRRSRNGPRKAGNKLNNRKSGNQHVAPPKIGTTCPTCNSDLILRTSVGQLRCEVCRNEWR